MYSQISTFNRVKALLPPMKRYFEALYETDEAFISNNRSRGDVPKELPVETLSNDISGNKVPQFHPG